MIAVILLIELFLTPVMRTVVRLSSYDRGVFAQGKKKS